jgi:hypothetical protein
MAQRFEMRQALGGILAGLEPLIHGTLDIRCRSEMMGEQLGLSLDEISEMLLQHSRDARVQLRAAGAQQGAVSRVLHQRMLEEIGGLWRHTAAEKQTSLDKPIKA